MAGSLAPFFKQTWSDANGNPLSGGKMYTYQAGTTTPQATYTDSSLGTPNANPVILNTSGQADIWLDPSLSYKVVLKDSGDVQQWSVDNVIGLLTVDAVNTAALQSLCVTGPKMALNSVDSTILKSDETIDANRAVQTNHVRDSAITPPKIAALAINRSKLATDVQLLPTLQKFTSGSGTYNKNYAFAITSGNATVGATYTNNGITYTVYATVSASTLVYMSGSGAPLASGTLTKASGTGDATLTFSSFIPPNYIEVEAVGAGAGGSGGSTGAGGGATGGNTTFGASLIVAGGGSGSVGSIVYGGIATTSSLGTGPLGIALPGGCGASAPNLSQGCGGNGGSSAFGGAGSGGGWVGNPGGSGTPGGANTGGGGGGGASSATVNGGGGGASGGYVRAMIYSPNATYAYTVGGGGAGGVAGTSGGAGGNGADGLIIVREFYQ